MCGIAGYFGHKEISQVNIQNTMTALLSRGPDYQDYNVINAEAHTGINVVLVHTRLAIIDLDARANQPFSLQGCTLVFNGEIYNYIELRSQLVKEGYKFSTSSDTEVLLVSYLHYGPSFTQHLEGMWSLAIWDSEKKKLLLSRDKFGEKPLYFYRNQNGVFFASEIKALKTLSGDKLDINFDQLMRYIVLGYKSLYKKKQTFFMQVEEVPASSTLVFQTDLKFEVEKYWHPGLQQQQISLRDAIEGVRYYMTESVRLRMRADVPLAFCLSGGVDSASLVSIASKSLGMDVTTFSIIENDPRYNELENVMHTVNDLKCKHHLITIPESGSIDRLKNQINYHDSPISTMTYFVHALLSEKISSHGFKVAFSGTSADELFTGYYDHFLLHLYQMNGKPEYESVLNDWEKHISGYIRNRDLSNPDLYIQQPNFRDHVFDNSNEFIKWINPDYISEFDLNYSEEVYCDSLLRSRMLNELFQEATPVILHEDDLNSMQFSVENRSPYLDSNLFDFVYSLPEEYLIREGYGKYLLRESMEGILNNKVRLDRNKKGFNASIHSIIDFNDQQIMDEFFDEGNQIFDYLDYNQVKNLTKQQELPNHYGKFLFNFLNSQIFLTQNL